MRSMFIYTLLLTLAACSSPQARIVDSHISSQRVPASNESNFLEGDWIGTGTSRTSTSPSPFPYVCAKFIARANKTSDMCSNYGSTGYAVEVKFLCADDNLSTKGKALFSQTSKLCESTSKQEDNKIFVTIKSLIPPESKESEVTSVGPEGYGGKSGWSDKVQFLYNRNVQDEQSFSQMSGTFHRAN